MLARLKQWVNADAKRQVHRLYTILVARARTPFFYRRLGVPDTLDGRFELVLLHLFLTVHRLKSEPDYLEQARHLTEAYFADMDRSLRELGVGDTGVSRRVKAMANACYGRMEAYGTALGSPSALQEALRRNLYATAKEPVAKASVARLAAYLQKAHEALELMPAAEIVAGGITFPEIEKLDGETI